ncbi:MAG: hypothetical protein KDD70_05985 [Bdellovibrionales bacterium]|nr:hypothetical protein [Bdellovibrionales bacterium]
MRLFLKLMAALVLLLISTSPVFGQENTTVEGSGQVLLPWHSSLGNPTVYIDTYLRGGMRPGNPIFDHICLQACFEALTEAVAECASSGGMPVPPPGASDSEWGSSNYSRLEPGTGFLDAPFLSCHIEADLWEPMQLSMVCSMYIGCSWEF